jgi:phosphatidylglycerol:prolipoprotein diacylglycerol transferase
MIGLMIGHAIGILGSFVSGIDYGKPTDLPWGVVFPVLGDGIARHPTQIYEFIGYFITYLLLLLSSGILLKETREFKYIFPGFIFFSGILLTFLIRFAVEFFRVPERVLFKVGIIDISSTHFVCLFFVIISLIFLVLRERQFSRE